MTTLRVQIEEDKDISVLQKVLTELGFKFKVELDDYPFESISQAEIFGIREGLEDLAAGRVYSNVDARSRIDMKIKELEAKYDGR